MAWIITRDHLAEEYGQEPNVGRGQWGVPGVISAPPETDGSGWRTFWLYDDDGVLYYSGRYDAAAEDLDDGEWGGLYEAFRWGMADSGATDLRVTGADGKRESVYG